MLIDARWSNYIDPDVLDLIEDFRDTTAPARNIKLSLAGLKPHYQDLEDEVQFVDFSARDIRADMTPKDVLQQLAQGNERFKTGRQLTRDFRRQVDATAAGQTPMAVVLSCIDSRAPAEHLFDLGIGDVFVARVAGNVVKEKVLGSLEYACCVAGSKLILVLGHTACGAVTSAVEFGCKHTTAAEATGCEHIDVLLDEIRLSMVDADLAPLPDDPGARSQRVDGVARRNVLRAMRKVRDSSKAIANLCEQGKLMIVGGMYDVASGSVDFFDTGGAEIVPFLRPLDAEQTGQRTSIQAAQ